AGALRHRDGDAAFIEAIRHDDDRDRRGELIAHGGGARELIAARIDEQQQLRIDLSERIAEIAQRRNPRAMHWMARAPQDAVDRLDRITSRAQNDERNGVLLAQRDLHHTWSFNSPKTRGFYPEPAVSGDAASLSFGEPAPVLEPLWRRPLPPRERVGGRG